MAKVLKGKQVFENAAAYAEHIRAMEAERGPFRDHLRQLNDEFAAHLAAALSAETVAWYKGIVQVFIDFLFLCTDVTNVEDITKGMANSHFQRYWRQKALDDTTSKQELRTALREFFGFLKTHKGMANRKVLASLKRSMRDEGRRSPAGF